MVINQNISALNAGNQLKINDTNLSRTLERLSSGKRINTSKDDASGLAVAEKMSAQIRGLKRAAQNVQDSISFVQTTEGYIRSVLSIVKRLRDLSVQSANGIYTDGDRSQIQVEVNALVQEIDRTSSTAHFNTLRMLTGKYDENATDMEQAEMWFHLGSNMDERIRVYIDGMSSASLGLRDAASEEGKLSLETIASSNKAIGDLDLVISKITKQLSNLGAYQNRLQFTYDGVMVNHENMQASESRIRDANMAEESINYFKQQILLQSSTAMLAQANMKSQVVLKLFS